MRLDQLRENVAYWAKAGGLKPRATTVLFVMWTFAGRSRQVYPTVERLADDSNLPRRTVERAIADLLECGAVVDAGTRRAGAGWVRVRELVPAPGSATGGVSETKSVPPLTAERELAEPPPTAETRSATSDRHSATSDARTRHPRRTEGEGTGKEGEAQRNDSNVLPLKPSTHRPPGRKESLLTRLQAEGMPIIGELNWALERVDELGGDVDLFLKILKFDRERSLDQASKAPGGAFKSSWTAGKAVTQRKFKEISEAYDKHHLAQQGVTKEWYVE